MKRFIDKHLDKIAITSIILSVVWIVVIFTLVACTPVDLPPNEGGVIIVKNLFYANQMTNTYIDRAIDYDYGNICYIFYQFNGYKNYIFKNSVCINSDKVSR